MGRGDESQVWKVLTNVHVPEFDDIPAESASWYGSLLRLTELVLTLAAEKKLGQRVRAAMKSDPLYPVFQYNTYLPQRSKFPKVTYRVSDFLDGLDIRMKGLKLYVAECVEEYGEENVLL